MEGLFFLLKTFNSQAVYFYTINQIAGIKNYVPQLKCAYYTAHRLNLQCNPTAGRQPSTFPEAPL